MADSTTGGLPKVREAAIGSLPGIADLYDDTLLPVEQQGEARHMTGRQWKEYAIAAIEGYDSDAKESAEAAKAAESGAKSAQQAIENMTVSSETLNAESPASVAKTVPEGVVNLHFGIPKGKDGKSFEVQSIYPTLEELEAAHPSGVPGEAYAVGTPEDNEIYIWDADNGKWSTIGPLQGTLANVITLQGGGAMELEGDFGSPPYKLKVTKNTTGGIPGGGAAGQVLAKKTAADFDVQWVDGSGGGGSGGSESVENLVFSGGITNTATMANTATGGSIALGPGASAKTASIAVGVSAESWGPYTIAVGPSAKAKMMYSQAFGGAVSTYEVYQMVIGCHNAETSTNSAFSRFVVGDGGENAPSNCFRVTTVGTFAKGSYNASGADYAELFEWSDGNPSGEDRCGLFVALDGDKIRVATPDDDYILGIVSGNPSVVGDVYDDQWQGMYLYDVFGRPVYEDVDVPDETTEIPDPKNPGETIWVVIRPVHRERRHKLNPAYDNSQPYIPRSERPEWSAVGLVGKLVAVDDGTCQVNGYCTVGAGGVATASKERTKYRVMERIDRTHIRVMIL